ncbi:endolytic transglycosylase MltG [Cereibacter sphaeroides]|uniref:endolytic transglycosylase MltG n=1 Tax=Cereibacter sphaeroides TaxID=1063 RepID=UPI001F1C817B|nr:endolytic transglycosylase MltG [Cereibacter sphaeroides]MCE6961530.1 endolytic transglycosylase MltG [Cereibacter sphaeroides]MCE6967845.1 endolytic transglycosylase MltG [Cereibacter sphaeroides]MCE6972567.1 endolytic transglycosylase MltG [Cereibacter sphaeroides]
MWRAIASNALTLFIVVLVAVAGLLAWGRQEFTGPGPLAEAVCIRIERGDSLSAVSQRLETQGAVSDPRIFRIGAEYSDKAGGLKFGSYLVPAGASMAQVLEILTAGGQSTCGREVNFRIGVVAAEIILREFDAAESRYVEVAKFVPGEGETPPTYAEAAEAEDLRWRVTLAEGVTSWQVVDSLRKADFLKGEINEVPPEGTLAPDSYEVERGDDRGALLAQMQERQSLIIADLWEARAADVPYATPQEALIMASIVEKETGVPEERPQVASVFVNRLAKGMRLQTDPTVIYGVTEGRGILGRGLRQSELRRRTDYNTYVIAGLPPTPIANPGRLSIEAALNPAKTDYLYFVADGSGGHAFAATLEEHNRNVAAWRKIEAERGRPPPVGIQGD